jgi:hypothetical protein
LKLIQRALTIAKFYRVTQLGWGLTTKWQALGRAIIELLKKEPFFVCGLFGFLSFRVLLKFRPPARMFFFYGTFWAGPPIKSNVSLVLTFGFVLCNAC